MRITESQFGGITMVGSTDLNESSVLDDTETEFDTVIAGLTRFPRELSPLWLYDETGSQLFDMICDLPEYYLTRAELEIMSIHGNAMAQALGPNTALIEFGSGTSEKTRMLLDRLDKPSAYIPVDIARDHLLEAAAGIARDYPTLTVIPLCADFTRRLVLPKLRTGARRVVYFPGSTLGNFQTVEAISLLRLVRDIIRVEGAALIGFDLRKDVTAMEQAYNDALGITAKFNLNALRHLNRDLGADFPLHAFEHRAEWVSEASRIEMQLVCKRDVEVHIGHETLEMKRGEYIRTECCHKYTNESFACLAASAGLQVRQRWFDKRKQFSVQLLCAADDSFWFVQELAAFRDALQSLNSPETT